MNFDEDDLLKLMNASSASLGRVLDPVEQAAVLDQLKVAATMAQLVFAVPLDDEQGNAAVFIPQTTSGEE